MDDILIISSRRSQVAHLWANFLKNCFGQISKQRNCPPFKMLTVCLEDLGASIPLALEEKMAGTRLQIVIICPIFLEHLYQHPEPASAVGRHLTPERVVAMLLGVDENSISEEHRAALISYNQWKHLQVKNNDTQFVADFLNIAMGILSRTPSGASTRSERAAFSVMPKKVKEGHNKVVVLLVEPLEKEDELCINVDKSGEMLEVTPVKRKNLYTVTFAMPASCLEISMLVGVHITKNGKSLGCRQVKCESRMGELDQILRSLDNPLEFMCQTLGCSPGDRDQLDNFLLTAFQRNLPPHFNLLNRTPVGPQQRHYSRPEEYPTLLHFAARYGLEKLAWQLLECPGGEQACDLRNVCELTPAEMAEKAGHSKLANLLKGYLQMSEFSSMYSYLKMVCQNQSNTPENLCETDYHKPRPLSETYQVPPSARPLPTISAESPTMQMNQASVMNGYMEMHPAGNGNTSVMDNPESEHQYLTFDESASNEDSLQQQLKKFGSTKSREQLFDNPQDELAEIISYFKNNVLTLAEVEKLVENWRNRNDVQKSIKDKQEQLDKMRSEYERLQRNMKGDNKSARPLEKIRHFFKSKGKEGKEQSISSKAAINFSKAQKTDPLRLRPSSSLSIQSATSSSSSEPVSIASGCSGASLGDSGTHSDPEDRKGLSNGAAQSDISTPGTELSSNHHNSKPAKTKTIRSYEVPPAPRPVNLNLFLGPTKRENPTLNLVENRPPLPLPRIFPNDCEISPTESDDYITPPGSSTQQSESFIQTISYTNIDPHVNKVSTNPSRGFQSVNETNNESSMNLYGESVVGNRNNHSQCFNELLTPETPSSPGLSIDENDISFPNYTNIVSPSFSVHAGDVFQLDVPPPLPPRLE